MHDPSRQRLLCVIGVLLLAALVALAADPWLERRADPGGDEFQRLVGGLGLGPAVRLSPDEAQFDPRIGAGCPVDYARVPGGGWLGGAEACSVFPYRRPFVAGAAVSDPMEDHAEVP